MHIAEGIRHFIAGPVMIIVGTCDRSNRPAIGRGVGARAIGEEGVEVVLSGWQWPETVANLRQDGRMAVTVSRPSDYVSYQLKGRARLRPADAADLELSRHYRADVMTMFETLGLAAALVRPWLTDRDALVACLTVAEIYIQTPGPRAGTAAGADA